MNTSPTSTTGLLGYYQFNEDWSTASGSGTADVSGNSNTGTLHNYTGSSQWVTSDAPVYSNGNSCTFSLGNTYALDQHSAGAGTPRFVSTYDHTLLAQTEGTVEAWVYLTDIDGDYNGIIAQHHSGGLAETMLSITVNGKVRFTNYQGVINGNNAWLAVTGNTTLCTNQWYHVAATWNCSGSPKVLKVYVNGALDGTSSNSNGAYSWHSNNTYSVGVGAWMNQATGDPAHNYCLIGYIDEARIWSDDLSEQDIRNSMNFSVANNATALELCYKFDNDLTDYSTNGIDGTAYSGLDDYTSSCALVDPSCSGSNCREVNPHPATFSSGDDISVAPNPAAGDATIFFGLTHDAEVVLNLYDLSGRLVSSINGGEMSAGENTLQLNTREFTEGTYLCELVSGDEVRKVRLVVAK